MLRFLLRTSFALAKSHSRGPYDVVHVHSVPDFEVFAAWPARWHGARVILDIHDLVPEFYLSKFNVNPESFAYRILLWIERVSARFADHIIISNHIWRETLITRSVLPGKCTVVLNNVDPSVFYPHPRTRQDNRFIIVYPGGLQWHQGLDLAVLAFSRIAGKLPHAEFHIYGDGSERASLIALIHELHMDGRIVIKDPVPFRDVPAIMANADLGVVPKRADSFGNEAYSTKIMEYMSQGVPVLASRTAIDQHYFNDGSVHFFASGDVDELSMCMLRAAADDGFLKDLIARGRQHVERNNWACKKKEYLDLMEALVEGRTSVQRTNGNR
jgi:glycosyltransferase involved in cell wall biosynthesis